MELEDSGNQVNYCMESYDYIESAVIFSILERKSTDGILPRYFAIHGEAYRFVLDYLDQQNEYPPYSLLIEKFDSLDPTARSISFDYASKELKKQNLYRQSRLILEHEAKTLRDDPAAAVERIIRRLGDIETEIDENIFVYDTGETDRHDDYARRATSKNTTKIRGVVTPVKSINRTGIGFLPGDLVSMFARPTVGKTWMAVKMAAIGVHFNQKTLFISPEMTNAEISMRLDVVLGQMRGYEFSHKALMRGEGLDQEKYRQYLSEVKQRNLFICDNVGQSSITMNDIQAMVRKHQPKILVVDGVHLMSQGNSEGGHDAAVWERMFNLFYGLKNLSISHQISSFVTTQAKRQASDLFTAPKMHEVQFGDALLQASDIVLSMCLVKTSKFKRMLQMQKYRHGEPPFEYTFFNWDVDRGIIGEADRENG